MGPRWTGRFATRISRRGTTTWSSLRASVARQRGCRNYRMEKFPPPMDMTCVERDMRDALAKKFDDRIMTIGRTAVLTQVHGGRAACHYCGVCHRGCITGSYFSSISATLPAAQKTGRLTLRPYSVVHSLIFDPTTRKVSGVRVIDAQTRNSMEFKGRIFFINASSLE